MLNNIVDKILAFLSLIKIQKIAIVLIVMFIWSGVNKVNNFEKRSVLVKKLVGLNGFR